MVSSTHSGLPTGRSENMNPLKDLRNKPRARKVVTGLIVLTFLAGFAQAAMLIYQNNTTVMLHAERYNVGDGFMVDSTDLFAADSDVAALGTQGAEVEMTAAFPAARTALVRDNWVYQVVLKEKTPSSGSSGVFTAQLIVSGVPVASNVFVKQSTLDAAVEGVTIAWNLGVSVPDSPLFQVKLAPFVQVGPIVEYTLKSKADGSNVWEGVSPAAIAGANGPALSATVGDTVKITVQNADANTHNFRIMNAGGATPIVAGPTPDINVPTDQQTLTWVPSAAGTYQYECQYHKSTMTGAITVA